MSGLVLHCLSMSHKKDARLMSYINRFISVIENIVGPDKIG